ncbi:MAG TPA: inositol monophosphatase family protein, partial [Pirellulales bacterium]|nr:inositol monophosphatase family protein [Pirellulales bacterium]
ARLAGQLLLDRAGRVKVREKGPADLVTEADLASQEVIRETLLSAFPGHGFLAEENLSIASSDDDYRWIVDPLDGTTNYVHGIPQYCVSIALERSGKLLAGTVYDPVADECFSAVAGGGAWLGERRLHVSSAQALNQAVIAMSFPPGATRATAEVGEFLQVLERAQSMRRMGSSALNLCYLAAGRFDGYWSTSTRIWDIAAGVLLVQEAGGVVTGRAGDAFALEPPHFIAAATRPLHAELSKLLAGAPD